MTEEKTPKKKSRRRFFKRAGIVLGGTIVAIYFGRHAIRRKVYQTAGSISLPSGILNFDTDLWFEVLPDNNIKLKSPKVEMGQGIFTGFAMLAAEELDVPLERIKVVPGNSTDSASDLAGTGGSSSTYSLYEPIREVAATLLEMLKLAAAKHWGIDVSQTRTEDGKVLADGQAMTYAQITEITEKWDEPKSPKLKPASAFKFVGKNYPRTDLAPKVFGEAIFAIDAELPDMKYAVRMECPYIGGKLKSVDFELAKKIDGVEQVVQLDELVAVVANSRYAAEMGARLLQEEAEWDVPKKWEQTEFEEMVTVGKTKSTNLQKEGNPQKVFDNSVDGVIKQEYRTPLGAHAQMEPNGAVADVKKDKALVILGSQNITFSKQEIGKAIDMDGDKIEIRNSFLGGGFGRRFFKSIAVDAARVSQKIGQPVHLFRTRESEFQNGFYRPNSHHLLQAKLKKDGSIEAIQHDVAMGDMGVRIVAGDLGIQLLGMDLISAMHGAKIWYEATHRRTYGWDVKMPVITTIWRGVGMVQNTFAIECFMDELAKAVEQDSLEFRLRHLQGNETIVQRMAKTLEAIAPAWTAPKPMGIGRGIALGEDRGTPSAAVVDVQEIEGQIRVVKVTQAIDPGIAINPEGIRQQVEGCTMMGISAALYEGLKVEDGKIMNSNFHLYPMASLKDTPEIEIIILENAEEPSGVGEPPIAPMAPAIANAIFDLTGERRRQLPLLSS